MFLLDTNVISELRKPKPHGAVLQWFHSIRDTDIQISAVVVAELQDGAELTRRQDAEKAAEIERWIDGIMLTYVVVPMDGAMFREWARLMSGRSYNLAEDAMIAATAKVNSSIVVTRNTKDFESFGVELYNPFTGKKG